MLLNTDAACPARLIPGWFKRPAAGIDSAKAFAYTYGGVFHAFGFGTARVLPRRGRALVYNAWQPRHTGAEDVMIFNLATAQAFAREERLAAWVDSYLRQPSPRANVPFADGLLRAPRWWSGPHYRPLDQLTRECGPEPEMAFHVPRDAWEQYVTTLAQSFTTPEALPPLIVRYDHGTYRISDGNNRHEAMRRVGWTSCWVIVWYTSEDDYQHAARTHA